MELIQMFYNSYVKKLKMSSYLMEHRLNKILLHPKKVFLSIPKELAKEWKLESHYNVTENIFLKYLK